MLVLPQRLLDQDFIELFWQREKACFMRKQFNESAPDRQGYLSTHAFSAVMQGEQLIQSYDGAHMRIKAGEIGFLPRGMYTITDLIASKKGFETYLLFLPQSVISPLLESAHLSPSPRQISKKFWKSKLHDPLRDLFDRPQELRPTAFLDILLNNKGGEQLYQYLMQAHSRPNSNMREFMERHFDKPLTIADYAYLTGRSLSSFHREFQQRFSTSPRQWIKEKRLEKSRQLLSEQGASVTDTVYAVGYQHISNFIKAFKARYQLTPKQYILQQRGKLGSAM